MSTFENVPTRGREIIFETAPHGSRAKPGVVYFVAANWDRVSLEGLNGRGTFDDPRTYRTAVWRYV